MAIRRPTGRSDRPTPAPAASRTPRRSSAVARTAEEGFKRMKEDQERAAEQKRIRDEQREKGTGRIQRFRMKEGDTAQIIVLDESPSFFRYEHNHQGPSGYYDQYCECFRADESKSYCPACKALGKEGYYAMYLSVIDLTPYTSKKTGKTTEFMRKLLVVKSAQQTKYARRWERLRAEGKSLRGAVFELSRSGSMSAASGDDIEYLEHLSEDDLEQYVSSWKDKEGKKHTQKHYEVYDYDEIMPAQTVEELEEMFSLAPVPGSARHDAAAEEEEEDDEDDLPWDGDKKKPAARTSAARRPVKQEEEEADDEEEEEEEAPPRRRLAGVRRR